MKVARRTKAGSRATSQKQAHHPKKKALRPCKVKVGGSLGKKKIKPLKKYKPGTTGASNYFEAAWMKENGLKVTPIYKKIKRVAVPIPTLSHQHTFDHSTCVTHIATCIRILVIRPYIGALDSEYSEHDADFKHYCRKHKMIMIECDESTYFPGACRQVIFVPAEHRDRLPMFTDKWTRFIDW